MIKRFDNIRLSVTEPEANLIKVVQKKLGGKIGYFKILKKSLDARDKRNIVWLYSVACSNSEEREPQPRFEKISSPPTVAVIGGGPAGLFCAVRLIEHGFRPLIIERGGRVEERRLSCSEFFERRRLDTESNVQFGEGGAGAFSDGKLVTRTKDGLNRDVLSLFVRFGAPQDVLYLNKPHVGSDRLYDVLRALRAFVEANGGSYMFDTKVCGLGIEDGSLTSLTVQNVKSGQSREIKVVVVKLREE